MLVKGGVCAGETHLCPALTEPVELASCIHQLHIEKNMVRDASEYVNAFVHLVSYEK
jgi:hypothetical protein